MEIVGNFWRQAGTRIESTTRVGTKWYKKGKKVTSQIGLLNGTVLYWRSGVEMK